MTLSQKSYLYSTTVVRVILRSNIRHCSSLCSISYVLFCTRKGMQAEEVKIICDLAYKIACLLKKLNVHLYPIQNLCYDCP